MQHWHFKYYPKFTTNIRDTAGNSVAIFTGNKWFDIKDFKQTMEL